MPPLVLGLDATFLSLDIDPVLVLDLVATFVALDRLLGLDATFLALDTDLVLGLDPVPAFLALDPVPSLFLFLSFLGGVTNHLFLSLFVAWVLDPFC
jgi:hypothetical protein